MDLHVEEVGSCGVRRYLCGSWHPEQDRGKALSNNAYR